MNNTHDKKLIDQGIKIADAKIYQEDKIWSRYSNDKVDIGEELARVIRTLSKALPLHKSLRALSIGSSAEPQFRILESTFLGGLYLLDVEKEALKIVEERIHRQHTEQVKTIPGDYTKIFTQTKNTDAFLKMCLSKKPCELITLHHSLYYSPENIWPAIFENLWRRILAPQGAIHAVLMACTTKEPYTTTWLYEHFIGKFFNCSNTQNLLKLKKQLQTDPFLKGARIRSKTHRVYFFVDDFEKFMAVTWMILLYPNIHQYTLQQKEEITKFMYTQFWKKKQPLIQVQDHLVVYRGIKFEGLV